MLFGLRVIVGGRSKGGAIFNPWRARTRTGKSLRASHCVARVDAPREARRKRRHGEGQTPNGPPSGDPTPRRGARGGPPAAPGRPRRGSFGHILASRHRLNEGGSTPA